MTEFKNIISVFLLILAIGFILIFTNINKTFNKTNNIHTSTYSTASTILIDKVSEV